MDEALADFKKAYFELRRDLASANAKGLGPSTMPRARSSDDVLQELADDRQRRDPGISRSAAISAAAMSKEFTAALRAEKVAKGL